MFTLPVISLLLLLIYVPDVLSSNALPPKNYVGKQILLSILIGLAIQLALITIIPGAIAVMFIKGLISTFPKAGVPYDWSVLIANMLLYAGFSFLIMRERERNKRRKKTEN